MHNRQSADIGDAHGLGRQWIYMQLDYSVDIPGREVKASEARTVRHFGSQARTSIHISILGWMDGPTTKSCMNR